MSSTAVVNFKSFKTSVFEILNKIGAAEIFAEQTHILIKPNLIMASKHPITTSPANSAAIVEYIQGCSNAEIVIAEGCGDMSMETDEVFRILGYDQIASQYNIKLVDLNHTPLVKIKRSDCNVFPEMYLPEIVFSHYLISVPVLKAHSLAQITGTLKNMMGIAPPKYYSGRFGSWKKAVFHHMMHQAIVDLNCYRAPDMTLMDASIGLADFHLGGRECSPHVNQLIAGTDPITIDRIAAELLGLNWMNIGHINESAQKQLFSVKQEIA